MNAVLSFWNASSVAVLHESLLGPFFNNAVSGIAIELKPLMEVPAEICETEESLQLFDLCEE